MNKRIDTQKLSLHPIEVARWLENDIIPPIYIELSLSDFCNHRCIFCAFDYYKNPSMIESFTIKNFLLKSVDMGIKACMVAGLGEPFLHKQLEDIIIPTSNQIAYAIATNGVLCTYTRLKNILPHIIGLRFSIDAGNPETHILIHKSKHNDYWQILRNVKDATLLKKDLGLDVNLMVQFLCLAENIESLPKFIDTYLNTDIDIISIKPYSKHPLSINNLSENYDAEFIDQLTDIVNKYNDSRLLVRANSFAHAIESNSQNLCYALSFWAYISGDGSVWACGNFVGNQDFYCGNIYSDSASEIWLGNKRKTIIERAKSIPMDCRANCRMQSCNNYLNELIDQKENKWYNFI